MGVFQSGINRILAEGAVVATTVAKDVQTKKEATAKAEAEKTAQAQAELEAGKKAQEQEQADIKSAEAKMKDAKRMALGYSKKDIEAMNIRESLGLEATGKNPRGVSNKAFDRRQANLQAQEEIYNKWIQNKESRDRILNAKSSDIAKAISPEVRSRKTPKKGGVK